MVVHIFNWIVKISELERINLKLNRSVLQHCFGFGSSPSRTVMSAGSIWCLRLQGGTQSLRQAGEIPKDRILSHILKTTEHVETACSLLSLQSW